MGPELVPISCAGHLCQSGNVSMEGSIAPCGKCANRRVSQQWVHPKATVTKPVSKSHPFTLAVSYLMFILIF
jgi:hypothetical protein